MTFLSVFLPRLVVQRTMQSKLSYVTASTSRKQSRAQTRIQEHQPISELDDLKRIQYTEDVEHIVRNGVAEIEKLEG